MSSNKLSLKQPIAATREGLTNLVSTGYQILGAIFSSKDPNLTNNFNVWLQDAAAFLEGTFPTQKEAGELLFKTGTGLSYNNIPVELENVINAISRKLATLEHILDTLENHYTYKAPTAALYINDIDSFSKVRGINHQ